MIAVSKLWADLETYSETPIKNGTYRYAEDSEIMLFLYAFDDGEVQCWDLTTGDPMPEDLEEAISNSDCEVWFHNSMFDRTVLGYNGINIPIERVRDTMVQALCHALPGSMDRLCEIFNIAEENAKLKDGKALIHLFCKPRPKNMKLRRATRETHPAEWARFIEYGKGDIRATRALHYAMPRFNYPNGQSDELGNWHLDQKINDRGFRVDLDLVNAAIDAVKLEKESLKQQASDLTGGVVTSATKRDQVLEHILMEYGIPLPDLTKATLERRLNDPDIPRGVKELLAIRLQATTTSTSKYVALQKAANNDGRCRGTIQFGGASRTLRAAGRTFQPQNLPSRGLLEDYEIDFGVDALKHGDAEFYFPNIMKLLSSCVRGVLVPSEGMELAVADLSAIEGRFTAWVSGEEWVLEAYREYDKGIGSDMYQVTYANAFKIEASQVTKYQRQIGKVMNLFLGYGGGVGAFLTGALGYGFDLEELAKENWDTLPDDQLREANSFYGYVIKRKMNTFGLSKEAFITCDVLKRLWREANPNIASMWTRLEEGISSAISNPGEVFEVGEFIKILRNKNWLRIRLPSGRSLCYANPRLSERGEISYMGMDQYTRKWMRLKGYGGLFCENLAQAGSRDILYGSMPRAEAAGFQIVLHVHDELVTEFYPRTELTLDNLCEILAAPVQWAPGLPLSAAGFQSTRYRK